MPGASTANGTVIAQLKANVSGAVQSLPTVTLNRGRVRSIIETIALAAQGSGARIAVARVPVGAAVLSIACVSDQGFGTATLAFGDYNADAIFGAAAVPGAAGTVTNYQAVGRYGVPITTGYDSDTGDTTKGYEDIIMTTGVAALPATGTLRVVTFFVLD